MNQVTYNIPAINCNHCVHNIKMEVSELQGVQSVEGDPQTKKVTISYDAPANEEKIVALLKEINYPPA
jgi:copper chaperone CopZ